MSRDLNEQENEAWTAYGAAAMAGEPQEVVDALLAEAHRLAEARVDRIVAAIDNSDETVAARRAMFTGFGWAVTP